VKLKTFILVSVVSFGLFNWANYASWSLPHSIGEEGVLGKKVWQKYNCVSCHTIFGNGGYVGSDLTHITIKRDRAELLNFFRNPPVIPPSKKRKHPGLNEEESQNLISYFEYLNSIPTLGWPPQVRPFKNLEGL
jgi:nitric oxide reductase subunit C